ncbi:hypothetical protein [Cupriavidus necator]
MHVAFLIATLALAEAIIGFLIPEWFPEWFSPAVYGLAILTLCSAAFMAGQLVGERDAEAAEA